RAARRARGGPAVPGRRVRRVDVHLSLALRRGSGRGDARARARRPPRRNDRDARVCAAARRLAASLGALGARRASVRGTPDLTRLARGRPLPRSEHPQLLVASRPRSALSRRRNRGRAGAAPQSRRRRRRLGQARVSAESRPAFYALAPGGWRDYVTLLHPPYTVWHLSFVAIGAGLAPHFRAGIFGLALLAFFLGMGLGAHALDELHGRPLETRIGRGALIGLATVSIAGAVAIGIGGAVAREPWLLAFVGGGAFIVVAYNLELFGGRFHGD